MQVWFWRVELLLYARLRMWREQKGQNISSRGIILGRYISRHLNAQDLTGPSLGLHHHIVPASLVNFTSARAVSKPEEQWFFFFFFLSKRTYFPQRDRETRGHDEPSALCFVLRGAKRTECVSPVPYVSSSQGCVKGRRHRHTKGPIMKCNLGKWS